MSIKVTYHQAKGAAIQHQVQVNAAKAKVISLPEKSGWIEFVDTQTGVAPNKIITKRQGYDLQVYFDEKAEGEADLIITDYYKDELVPLLGMDSQQVYHAYVAELAESGLSVQQLADGVISAQVLSTEAFSLTSTFPWWHIGTILGGLGTVALVAGRSGGAEGGATDSGAKPEQVTFEAKNKGDGSISFDLPKVPNNIKSVDITYTPTNSDKPVVGKIEKDPATGKYVSKDPNIKVDPISGKVEIPEGKIKDGTEITVVTTNDKGVSSEATKTTAGQDYTADTKLESPAVTKLIDKSTKADNNPEELIVAGKSEPNAEITIKDQAGNVVGKGYADANGDFSVKVTEKDNKDNNDINEDKELTVISKVAGKNPTEETITVPSAGEVPIEHVGDSVGPKNPPATNIDPKTGDLEIPFPTDGETNKVNVDLTPKGQTDQETLEVSKTDNGLNVKYQPNEGNPVNIDRTTNPETGGSSTDVTFTPTNPTNPNNQSPVSINVEKDGKGNQTTTIGLTPEGQDKPLNIEVTQNQNGDVDVKIKNDKGEVVGGKDDLPSNVKIDENGNILIDTDGNTDTPPDTKISNNGSIEIPPGITVTDKGQVEIDNDGNKDTPPVVVKDNGDIKVPAGSTEPNTEINVSGEDLAGKTTEATPIVATEPATPNPNGGTPLAPTLVPNDDGSVTATLPTVDDQNNPIATGSKVVLIFNKEPNGEETKVTLVKTDNGWEVDPSSAANATGVSIDNTAGTATINPETLQDGSTVKAYSQGPNDNDTQKSSTAQAPVAATTPTDLDVSKVSMTSHNDGQPAKLGDITELKLTGTAGATEAGAKLEVKLGEQVIAEGTANADGSFTLTFREPDGTTINASDKLVLVATAPNKKASDDKEVDVPEIANDRTGYKNDDIAPEIPTVVVGGNGDKSIKITPNNPQVGDVISVKVTDNKGVEHTLLVKVDENGQLVADPSNSNNPDLTVTIKDGVIELNKEQIKDNSNLVVTVKDIAGNSTESNPVIENTGFDALTPNPTIASIVAHDTDLSSNKNPEEFTITGTAAPGSKVIAKDNKGNIIGETTANPDGSYSLTARENGNDIKAGDTIIVTAQQEGKGESAVPASSSVGEATTHARDSMPPKPAVILPPSDNGDVVVNLPDNPQVGDQVVITLGKDTNNDGKVDQVTGTVTLEKQEDGWKPLNNPNLVSVSKDNDSVTIPNAQVPNGTTINVESKDVAGNTTPTEATIDNKLPQTAAPTDIRVVAKDEDNPSDGQPDSMRVTGKAEKNAEVTVVLNGKEYSGKADAEGNFSIQVAAEDLKVGDNFSVKAQAENKTPSPETTTGADNKPLAVPNATEFADNVGPAPATIGEKTPEGNIPVNLDPNAQVGDQYVITVGKDTNNNNKLDEGDSPKQVVVEKTEDGWKVVEGGDSGLVTGPITDNTALIPAGVVTEEGTKINVKGKDKTNNANNSSEVETTAGTATPTETTNGQTDKPVIDEVKAVDMNSAGDSNPERVIVKGTTTEPNTEVTIKDSDGNVIGKGKSSSTANKDGTYDFEIEATELKGKDLTRGETLTITAKAEGKSESPAATNANGGNVTVPDVENNASGHPQDTAKPTAPEVAQKIGSTDAVVLLPKDAKVGDQVSISKDLNGDQTITPNEVTTLEKGENGQWTVKGENPLNVNIDNANTNGEVTVPNNNQGDKILVESKDLAGNTSLSDSVTIEAAKQKSTPPTEVEIKAIDTSKPADSKAEEIRVKGKVVGAEKGTKVLVLDDNGNELGEGTVTGDNGEFDFNVPAGGLTTGATLSIKALEKGKEISDAGVAKEGAASTTDGKTTLPAVENNAEGHPNDTTPPSAPQLIALPNSGAVAVMLPTDANAGDQVEVKFTDEAGNPQTVLLTKKEDGIWESSAEELIPHVKEKLDQPKVIIPENSLKDGQPVSAKSKDGFVDGQSSDAAPLNAGTDAKTAAPTELKVVATDKNPQADGDLDSITVSGKAEPNSLVVIYKGDQEIGRVQLTNGETNFSLEIPETADTGTITANDPIKVVAKVEGKEVSNPETSQVPTELKFVDETAPAAPTVQASSEPGNGSVTVSIPESPAEPFVRGDQLVIEYIDEDNEKQTALLTYDGKGNWNSDKPAEIPSIKKGSSSTEIPERLLADKKEPTVTAYFKDNAGLTSTTPATAIAGYDEVSATPTVDSVVGTDTDGDGKPDIVVIKGKLLKDGAPVANADVTVSKDGTTVGTPVKTNDKGEYEITLTEGQNNVGAEINPNDVFKVSAKEADKEVSATADAVVPKITTLRDVNLVAIDLDTSSNETPEQFVISGTAEQGATVQAVITVGDKEVVIGEVTVNAENGQFTLTTTALADLKQKEEYRELLKDFTYAYDKPSTNDVTEQATAIRLVATKEGQSPSTAVNKDATHVQGGQGNNGEPNRHPNDKTAITEQNAAKATALPEGFGGAKIELPPTEGESYLVVTLKYPQAGDGAESTVVLTWNGQNWTAAPTDVVTISEKDDKFVARLPAEKVSAVTNDQPNSIKVTTEDYAGNTSGEKTVQLNKPAGDTIPDRTDTPTIKAGSDNDAGDIVATPGADNTKMELTYVDQSGQSKTITVVKDMDAAEWKVQGDKPETVTVDPATGKITVPADLAKDGEEARAVGFKDNDDPKGSEKPYSQPYTHADGTSGSLEVVDEVKITVNASDKTVTEADEPSVTPLNNKFAGAATVKGGADNVKVEMVVTGYVDASGQIVTKEHAAKQEGTDTPITKDLILFAIKDPKTGEWTVVGTTKDKYEAAPENQKETVLSPISNDIATVTKDGTITLKANALQDNSAVKAKGYDALGNTNPTGSEYKSQTVGADPENKDVDADEPYVPVTGGDGSMTAKPGEDNTSMKVTFNKDNQKNTLEIEKDSNGKWKVKDGSQITANGEASVEDGQITLSNGAKLNPNTGEVYFPAGTVDFDSEFTAVGTNKDGYESESVSKPVLEDPTPVAEAPIAVVEGNKVVVTPGADSKSITLKGTNVGTDPVIEKGSNGEWALKNGPIDGISVDAKTGKVTIDSSKIAADGQGIVAEATDGWKPTANTASSNGGQGVRPVILDDDARSTEAPTISAHKSGEKQGSVDITPQRDHNSVTVDYKDEQDRPQSITATRNPETGEWSLQPIVTTDEHGNTVVTPVPASKATIDPTSGVISLKADELKDGENITATGRDVNGNSKSTVESDATKAPNDPEGTKLPDSEQPTGVPEVVDNPTPPQAETPTLFENVGVGHVRIKPGDGVDYISFNVAIDVRSEGTYQGSPASFINYVLIKNDSGAWEKYAYKITDRNSNGSIDPEEHDSFEDVKNSPNAQALEMISWDESSKSFNLKTKEGVSAPSGQNPNDTYIARLSSVLGDKSTGAGDKQNKIFDIMIGKEGGETVVALPPNGSNGNMTINDNGSSSATAIADFDLLGNNTYSSEAGDIRLIHNAPRYHHVLSNGDDLSAPVFKVTRVNSNGNMTTTLEANVDPDVKTLSFTANVIKDSSRNEVKTFNFIRGENNKWTFYTDPNYPEHDSYAHKAMLITEDGQPNKFIIKSGNGWKFYVDDPSYGQYSGDDRNKYIENVKYGAKAKTGDEDSSISKFYGTSYNASDELIGTSIPLANIDLTQGETINTTTPPSLPATPSEPAGQVEAVDTPTATAEGLGAVKVKPAENNSGAKYSVSYIDEATGQSKVINVKKTNNQWTFDPQGSTGSIDGQKISLNAQTGELTFAPEAVRDGGKVTITAYDSQGSARAQKEVVAADEPITVKLINDKASENIGGAKATPTTGTNKFKLTFTDEGNNINVSTPTEHSVVYQKVGNVWKVVEVDGKQGSTIKINGVTVDLNAQQNGYLTVNSSTGEVTIDRNSLKDGDPVSMIPYSKRGTESSGNAKTITTEKDKLTTALDDSSQKLGQLVGTDHRWGEVAIKGNANDSYTDGLVQLVHGKRHDKSNTNNAKATVTALTPEEDKATVSLGKGKRLSYSDNNDVVKIGEKVMNHFTWDPTLKFDFKKGDDILAVGHDLGYSYGARYNGLKSEYEHRQKVADRHRVQVEMGAGNDILAVGFHDNAWDVIKHRETGFLAIHQQSQDIHNYEKVRFLNSDQPNGGQLAGAKVFMGEGNDTVLLKGTWHSGNWQRASKNSIIDLGEGDNRLILTPDSGHGRALSSTKVNAGSGNDVVTGDTFFESSEIYLGGGSDEFIAAFVENTTVDLGHGDDWAEVSRNIGSGAKILLGAGNDVFSMKAGLSPNNSRVDGGSGVDTLLIEKNGAHVTNHNIKGFENVLFKANNTTLGIRADYFGSIEGPMKVSKLSNVTGTKVDLGMNNNLPSNAPDAQPGDKADGSYRWTKESMKVEGDTTYNVYKYVAGPYYVWIENGIDVI